MRSRWKQPDRTIAMRSRPGVWMPKTKATHKGYAYVEFAHDDAVKVPKDERRAFLVAWIGWHIDQVSTTRGFSGLGW